MAKAPRTTKARGAAPAAADTPRATASQDMPIDAAPDAAPSPASAQDIDVTGKMLRIRTASQATRRRAGRSFGPEAVEIEADTLNDSEVAALFADAQLLIELV